MSRERAIAEQVIAVLHRPDRAKRARRERLSREHTRECIYHNMCGRDAAAPSRWGADALACDPTNNTIL